MNINQDIDLINIESRKELLEYYDGISNLFLESFGKPLDRKLWNWAYLENPFGQPKVAIALHKGIIIGHYAVIPMDLDSQEHRLSGYLSMTTMVAAEFRKLRLFQRLADMVYERIQQTKCSSIVFGFPNDNSAPGFKKRLGWTISDAYKVVSVKPCEISAVVDVIEKHLTENCFSLDMNQESTREWRTSKPNQTWSYNNKIGTKEIDSKLDLMHIADAEQLKLLDSNKSVNMILPIEESSMLKDIDVSFDYRFGYRTFNCEIEPRLFVQMSMSDIF